MIWSKPFLILVTAFQIQSSLGQETNLSLATFNCEFLTRPKVHVKYGHPYNLSSAEKKIQKEWDKPGYRDSKYEEAAQAVAEFLAQLNVDVLALTEVGDSRDLLVLQESLIAVGLQYPYLEVGKSNAGGTAQNVAVLSRFPLKDPVYRIPGRKVYLEEQDDPESENETGISKGMMVTIQMGELDFVLYVLHLQSERGGHENDQKRIAQASIIRRHALPYLDNDGLVIIAGDLNDRRGQPALTQIRGFNDVYQDFLQTGNPEYFDPETLDTRWTYQYKGIKQQIDHILISQSIRSLCQSAENIRASTVDHGNEFVSDHNPFVLNLTIPDH